MDADGRVIDDPEEWSQGVLITDLSNFIQPVIRYYVNDMVRVLPSDESCSSMPILKVQGRTFPMFTAAGKSYSVAGLYSKAKVWPDLVSFQFVQVDHVSPIGKSFFRIVMNFREQGINTYSHRSSHQKWPHIKMEYWGRC